VYAQWNPKLYIYIYIYIIFYRQLVETDN
jgi:hypothetical protein